MKMQNIVTLANTNLSMNSVKIRIIAKLGTIVII